MDFADVLDMMDDDCDIQGFPNEPQSISREEVESQFVTRDEFESLLKRFRHLIQSNFIRSFDEVEPRTGAYKRDISEADASTGWISVNERLPDVETGTDVLVYDRYVGICTGRYVGAGIWELLLGSWRDVYLDDVTHWMPLPDPPESLTRSNIVD